MTSPSSPPAAPAPSPTAPAGPAPAYAIELGWLVIGSLDEADRRAVFQARAAMLVKVKEQFPAFKWMMPLVERRDLSQTIREEPATLLAHGMSERDTRHWDFVFVITGADLVSHYGPFMLAAPARALGSAVISTSRIDPLATGAEAEETERSRIMAGRLLGLGLHLFGYLNGVDPTDEAATTQAEHDPQRWDDHHAYDERSQRRLETELHRVADLRLEEATKAPTRAFFYLRAALMNRKAIGGAVWRARPWELPFRLSRLTTAAVSVLLILMNTAETWEVAMSQSGATVTALSVAVLGITTWYILTRQGLLLGHGQARLTEQTVVTRVSLTVVVALGLITTYLALFAIVTALSHLMYPPSLARSWAASIEGTVDQGHYLALAGFIAALGMAIGALGASFEQQHYFWHVAYVDEEL